MRANSDAHEVDRHIMTHIVEVVPEGRNTEVELGVVHHVIITIVADTVREVEIDSTEMNLPITNVVVIDVIGHLTPKINIRIEDDTPHLEIDLQDTKGHHTFLYFCKFL